jgi:prepilin signal peptidase PulO-like enzyme (type II secretory pathway)
MTEIDFFLNPPLFFISMTTVAKFVLTIPLLLVYLVPLDVNVVPDVRYYFAMAILVIILILIILLPHIFVRSISRRCLDQIL